MPNTRALLLQVKLSWMNGQHLKQLPADEQGAMLLGALVSSGLPALFVLREKSQELQKKL